MKNLICTSLFFLLMVSCLNGQNITINHSYGGSGVDNLRDFISTSDGGCLLAGTTSSPDGDISNGTYGYVDYWIVKTDVNGVVEWEKNYGGSDFDYLESIIQTTDGGYMLGGRARSSDGDVGGTGGRYDYWIVKTDSNGNIEWEKDYGSLQWEELSSVIQTADGGYLIGGHSEEASGDVSGNNGNDDYWIVKIDVLGNIEWEQNYGTATNEIMKEMIQTTDGGYMLGGSTVGSTSSDYWMVKIDANGNVEWSQYYGENSEGLETFIQTNDGGYLLCGWVIVNGNYNGLSSWVVKIDANGNIEWDQTYGGSERDYLRAITQLDDGNYLLAGSTQSSDGDIGDNNSTSSIHRYDAWVIKTDVNGNIEWSQNYGGTKSDGFEKIIIDSNGNYVLAGTSNSDDIDVTNNSGSTDFWFVKIEGCINLPHLTIDPNTVLQSEFQATLIETIGNVNITSSDAVTFKSIETILNQEFEVQSSGIFCIYNNPCEVIIPVQNGNTD